MERAEIGVERDLMPVRWEGYRWSMRTGEEGAVQAHGGHHLAVGLREI